MRENVLSAGVEVVVVGEASIGKAQRRVEGCQSCSASVSHPFSSVLTEVIGACGAIAEYVLCAPASCPNCNQPIFENTLVRCEGDEDGPANVELDFGRCWNSQQ
jgi:hypothetical protein